MKSRDLTYALELAEERFSLLYQEASDPIFLTAMDGTLLSANPAFEAATGQPVEAFYNQGKSWADVIHEDDLAGFIDCLQACARSGEENRIEVRLHAQEQFRWMDVGLKILHDEARQPKGLLGIAHDIHLRKVNEMELRFEAARMEQQHLQAQTLIGKLKHLLTRISSLPNEASPFIVGVCRVLSELYPGSIISLSVENEGGRKTNALDLGPEVKRIDSVMHQQMMQSNQPLRCADLNAVASYREDRNVAELKGKSFLGAPMQDSTGIRRGSLGLFHNQAGVFDDTDVEIITIAALLVASRLRAHEQENEREELEGHLRQSQKMEAVGKMAGGIAHDFNNILSGILGFSSYLVNKAEPNSEMHHDLSMIVKSAERASDLTRQLLAFARKRHFEKEPMGINTIIEEAAGILTHSISKRIQIEKNLGPGLPMVMGDSGQLSQVFMNLCINAADAIGSRRGRITIHSECRNLSAHEAQVINLPDQVGQPYIYVTVEDSGNGMSAEVMEHLFEPFFTTKAEHEGTGLGLSIVYGIMSNHNGGISVTSEEGRGSTFHLYLPVCESPAETETLPAQEELQGNETILIVDDEYVILRMVEEALRQYGYTVLTADDGNKALTLMQSLREEVDLILLDVVMPQMDGITTFNILKHEFADTPVIMMSGYASEDRYQRLLKTDSPEFLEKPFRVDELARRVREVLDGDGKVAP